MVFTVCRKTGTAENYAKIGGMRVKMEDHSIFVAFAPMENQKYHCCD
jgi:penicillin-binding protein 2